MYIGYFNEVAYDLINWSFEELKNNNRSKCIKIQRIADEIELEYRKRNKIPLDDIWSYKPFVNQFKHAKITKFAYGRVFK